MSKRERMKKIRTQRIFGVIVVLVSVAFLCLVGSGDSVKDCDGTGAIFTMAMGVFMTLTKQVWLL